MVTGYNTDVKHSERVYHVQTEDKGIDNPVIETLIYTGGKIIASRQSSYAALLRQGYNEKAVQDMLDAQHRKMMRDVRGGKFDPDGPPSFGSGIITDRGFDDLVLEFLHEQARSESIELVLGAPPAPRAGDLLVLDVAVRTDVRHAPAAGVEVTIRGSAKDSEHEVTLFTGVTDEQGRLRAGIDMPREMGGGSMKIEAKGPRGTDETSVEIQAAS